MFKNKKSIKIKNVIIQKFQRNPKSNYLEIRDKFIEVAKSRDDHNIHRHIEAIKMTLKERI